MEPITLQELVQAVGGTLLGDCRESCVKITGAESDNRVVKTGDVFFAFVVVSQYSPPGFFSKNSCVFS